jgi:hypothetical protein
MLERITTPNIRGEGLGQPAAKCGLPGRAKGMNNNNFEMTIAIKGLEVTCNGCTCEDIQISSKGNFGNEYVAVLGDIINRVMTKIPDAPAPNPVKRVIVKESLPAGTFDDSSFVEVQKKDVDLPKVYEEIETILSEKTGWEGDYGQIEFDLSDEEDLGEDAPKDTASVVLEDDHIKIHVWNPNSKKGKHIYLRKSGEVFLTGVAKAYLEKFFKESKIYGFPEIWESIERNFNVK